MISLEKKQHVLSRIGEIERFVLSHDGRDITIGDLCSAETAKSAVLANSLDSLAPILRTALVINWRESAMKSRYERFVAMFPEVSTLSDLKHIMDTTDPLEFCTKYLNINSSSPHKNPKYCLLRELTEGFLAYQREFGLPSEIEAIRHWSARVDLSNLKHDFIGKRRGVGPGVVQNIRLNLGERVVKPDRHVIGVMKHVLGVDIPLAEYGEFARFMGIDPRYLDCLLFEYGKMNNSSTECADTDEA